MNTPGFTAETSLYRKRERHRMVRTPLSLVDSRAVLSNI
jgi:hypothetical protein